MGQKAISAMITIGQLAQPHDVLLFCIAPVKNLRFGQAASRFVNNRLTVESSAWMSSVLNVPPEVFL